MIGGTFWLLEFILYLALGGAPTALKHISLVNSLNAATVSVLGVIGLIMVFSTGLLLDLASGPMFRVFEAFVLSNHLRQHRSWLENFFSKSTSYIQQDYAVISTMPTYPEFFRARFVIWKRKNREMTSLRNQFKVRRSYVRLSSFILAYVSLASGADKIEILGTQMSLWTTSRAIGMGLMMSVVVLPSLPLIGFGSQWGFPFYFAAEIAFVLLTSAAYFLAVAAFDRFCSTLFALIYVIDSKNEKSSDGVASSAAS